MFAKIPEIRSSAKTPMLPLSFSDCRMGKGFKMSKNLKNTKDKNSVVKFRGIKTSATLCPATSSITTHFGSLSPLTFITFSTGQIPEIKETIKKRGGTNRENFSQTSEQQKLARTMINEQKVPGNIGKKPLKKKDAITVLRSHFI